MRDPNEARMQELIALLYGELPEEKARELRALIEKDPELRAEWEELGGTRLLLQKWDLAEKSPRLVFVTRAEEPVRRIDARRRSRGEVFGRALAAPSWGFAAAAAMVALLAVGGFHVDRAGGGLALHFGRVAPSVPVQPVAGNTYVTRDEFESQVRSMGDAVLTYLDAYGRSRDQSMAVLLQTALTGVNAQQAQNYRELRNRIDGLGAGLFQNQVNTSAQVDYLLRQNQNTQPEHQLGEPVRPSGGDSHE